jgi:hypothetical protein
MEPTFITFKSPYGGLGLRARTANKAIQRIEGLLAACAADPQIETIALRVGDPSGEALAADLCKEHLDHAPCAIATEALEAFGPPNGADVDTCSDGPIVHWVWDFQHDLRLEGTNYAPLRERDADAAYADWAAFLRRHHVPIFGEYNPQVALAPEWAFRMHHPTTGEPAGERYPLSKVDASLSGRWSSAFMELVFPFATPDDEFALAYERVNEGLGMKLPPKLLRIDSPTRAGDRKWNKLPAWAHG